MSNWAASFMKTSRAASIALKQTAALFTDLTLPPNISTILAFDSQNGWNEHFHHFNIF